MSKKITNSTSVEQRKIGEFIVKLREKRGMTQGDLADAINTSQSAIARMEKGEQNFSTEMLLKIGAVLQKPIISLGDNSINFKVNGGKKLSGTIITNTAKNSAMSILSASILNKGKTTLENVPKIEEVYRMIEVLESIGMNIRWDGSILEIVPPKKYNISHLNKKSAEKMRSTIMLVGPLVHFLGEFSLPHVGGCKLGKRTITPHLFALEKLGIKIETTHDAYNISGPKMRSSKIVMYEAGDTATENAIMASALIPGVTTIKKSASNYMVQDLCFFLQKLGVKIEGIGTSTLVIHGMEEINTDITYPMMEDPIESMMFISLAVTTNSSIEIQRCPIDFLELELLILEKMGLKYKILKEYKSKNGKFDLVDIKIMPSKLTALEESIHPRPYPGVNIDNLPFFVPIATQAQGRTMIHDWVYENRAIYYMEVNKLGANMTLADPHRVFIDGVTKLKSAEIVSPPALRPAAIVLICMLSAEGTSILRNVYSINRGYEDLVTRLKKLGADIEIMEGL